MAEQEELVLLERVFLRLGSAESDDQLELQLGKFLTPVLLKLSSSTDGVRKKVMELLVHINKRVKSRPKVKLPVSDLLQQFCDASVAPFVTNFTVIYIKMGFPRLPSEQQVALLPQLLLCLPGRPEAQQNSFLQLIMVALPAVKPPTSLDENKCIFWAQSDFNVLNLLLEFMLDTLLLPYNFASCIDQSKSSRPSSAVVSAEALPSSTIPTESVSNESVAGPPSGLSESALKRFATDSPPSSDDLEKIKVAVVQLVGSGAFAAELVACHLAVASADTRHSVATAADIKLKQLVGPDKWSLPAVTKKLYLLFLGSTAVKGQPAVKAEHKRTPAGIQLRLRLMPYLLKSTEAANQFPECIQIVFDCLNTTNTNARLKLMAINFVIHMCQHASESQFKLLSSVLLSGMVKLVAESKEDVKLRCKAYIAIGRIGQRAPQQISKDISLVQILFDSLSKEDGEVKSAIQETLALLASSFTDLDPTKRTQMEAVIMQNIDKAEPTCRLMAVRYAIAVFPTDHVASRFVLLLACGDQKEDIFSEASKALKLVLTANERSKHMDNGITDVRKTDNALMPAFVDMIAYVQKKAEEAVKGPRRFVFGNSTLAFNPGTYIEILMYLRMCLAYSAGLQPDVGSTAAMQMQAPCIGRYVRQLIVEKGRETGPVTAYVDIAYQLVNALNGTPAMYCLLEIIAMVQDVLAPHFVTKLSWIKGFVANTKEDMCQFAAELYAVVCVYGCSSTDLTKLIRDLITDMRNQTFEVQRGAILSLGFVIGRLLARNKRHQCPSLEKMDTGNDVDQALMKIITEAVKQIALLLDNTQHCISACTALSEIGRNGHLPFNDSVFEPSATSGPVHQSADVTLLSVVDKLICKVQSSKESGKVREKSALCLGYLCIGEPDFPYRMKIIRGMMDSAAAKQYELHCTIGQALVCAAQGSKSPLARDVWTSTEEEFEPYYNNSVSEVKSLLSLLLDTYAGNANPHIRQAACVWLLALVSKCGDDHDVQSRIMHVQDTFIALLSDGDDLTQDVASQGLGAVYEKCSSEEKQSLVSALVDTLMTGKRKRMEVQEDTPLFPEGGIGKTPEGQNMSTYKELCSIANDLNQPDLIYKFLHLANHQATWNTKKGAAVGFSTIASQAGEQLAPYLDKILPKLYRYQFDPSARIQLAMTSIWHSLVTDNQKTVSKYMKQILDDLIKNMTNSQWRIRESSCLALNDLFRGRSLDDVVDELPVVWETCFRVRDDIKESVRNAADTALKTLSRASIKMCDPDYGKVGEKATGLVLSCLLTAGMASPVAEVRSISLTTIMKISKSAGPLLRPHVPLLVVPLLESMTTLEPQVINYYSLHATSNQEVQDKLDSARLAAYKSTPMMEVINLCVQYVDESVLAELVPRLTELIRNGVGLGTKAGCASFVVSLVRECPRELVPHSGKILGAILNSMNDRNAAVRKTYAVAIGNLVKVSKDASVERVIQRIKQWYLEKEDETVRLSCEAVVFAINEHSPDVLKAHAALALPLVFIAMHQVKDSDSMNASSNYSSLWQEVWNDVTPGTEAGLRLYMTEIVELTQLSLASSSWSIKAQGAAAMVTIAEKLKSNLGPPHLGILLRSLLSALPGRTWTGKESLLKALSAFTASCREELIVTRDGQPSLEEITVAVIRECRRENVRYKIEALRCMASLVQIYDVDRFSDISDILLPLLSTDEESESKSILADVDKDTKLAFNECAYECLGKCWPKRAETQELHQQTIASVLQQPMSTSTWKVQVSALVALRYFISQLICLENSTAVDKHTTFLTTFFESLFTNFSRTISNMKYSAVRLETLSIVEVIVKRLTVSNRLNILTVPMWKQLLGTLSNVLDNESQPDVRDRTCNLQTTIRSNLT